MADISIITICLNDAPLWSDTFEVGFYQATQWLDLCGKMGLSLKQTQRDMMIFNYGLLTYISCTFPSISPRALPRTFSTDRAVEPLAIISSTMFTTLLMMDGPSFFKIKKYNYEKGLLF